MTARTRLLGVLWAAGVVSVVCNVLAADPTVIGRGVAAWPPIALLLVVEVLARSPLPAGRLRWAAVLGAGVVAVTAAIASFHHMHEVALTAGESELVAWLFPLTVDGLAVVASTALVATHTPPTRMPADGPEDTDHGDGLVVLEEATSESVPSLAPLPRPVEPPVPAVGGGVPGPVRFGPAEFLSSASSSGGVVMHSNNSNSQGVEL